MSLPQCTFLKITDDSAAENNKRGLAVLIVIVKYQICITRRYVLSLGWVGPVFWLVSAFLASCKPLVYPILANFSSIFLLIGNFRVLLYFYQGISKTFPNSDGLSGDLTQTRGGESLFPSPSPPNLMYEFRLDQVQVTTQNQT